MQHTRKEQMEAFGRFLDILDELRVKCPWDKKQTNESLRPNTIEETYELADAIIENDTDEIKKEVGDLLLHIVFYAKIGSEENAFDIKSVIDSLNESIIEQLYFYLRLDDRFSGDLRKGIMLMEQGEITM